MVLDKIFGKSFGRMGEADYIELDTAEMEASSGKVQIKVEKLEDFSDSDRIQKSLRDGSIVLCKIKALKEKDLSELKRAIDKLRKTCVAMNGDIAGVDEDFILMTPSFAHVNRE